jgi:N-acetylmuramoyl-L-alanine amidase
MTPRVLAFCGLASIALIGFGHAARDAMAAPSPAQLMARASVCDQRLLASADLKRLRSEWARCIARYADVVSTAPDDPLGKTALKRQAELTQFLARRSGRATDVADATALFARLRAWDAAPPTTDARGSGTPEPRPTIRVVIDPGHGGKDPGAIGWNGLQEKDIVLDVAKRLHALLKKQRRITPSLTRSDDQFLSLEARTSLAAQRHADLFVSIHANASPRADAKGVETYVLGRSSDADASATAERENAEPGEVAPDTGVIIQAMLADLSDTTREEQSLELANAVKESVVRTVGKRYPIVDLGIKRAPFYVLLNAGMPSILAEVAFLSNRDDAARLSRPAFRQQLAEALAAGILDYAASPVLTRLE